MDADQRRGSYRFPSRRRAVAAAGLTLAAAGLLAACGGSSSTSASTPPATTSTPPATTSSSPTTSPPAATGSSGTLATNSSQWMTVDSASKSVRLTMDAAHGDANNGFNFNGYANGQMVVTIPVGWKVTVECKNESDSVNHSCAVVKNEGDTLPAFPGASTPAPVTGTAPGESSTFEFTPTTAGEYRIDCLVPGHDPAGMWAALRVVESGTPSVSTTGTSSSGSTTAQNS